MLLHIIEPPGPVHHLLHATSNLKSTYILFQSINQIYLTEIFYKNKRI